MARELLVRETKPAVVHALGSWSFKMKSGRKYYGAKWEMPTRRRDLVREKSSPQDMFRSTPWQEGERVRGCNFECLPMAPGISC